MYNKAEKEEKEENNAGFVKIVLGKKISFDARLTSGCVPAKDKLDDDDDDEEEEEELPAADDQAAEVHWEICLKSREKGG